MSLFSCFGQSKSKKNNYEGTVRRSRRLSRENEVVYVEMEAFADQPKFNGKIRHVYRTEHLQTPQYETLFGPDGNRQSRSYPVSPERKSWSKVYSFEQRPSFENNIKYSREPKNFMVLAATVGGATKTSHLSLPYGIPMDNIPRRSTLTHGVDYEKELLVFKGSPRCIAEKQAEEHHQIRTSRKLSVLPALVRDDDQNMQGNESHNTLKRLKEDNKEFFPRKSSMASQNIVYLATDDMATEPAIRNVVRATPQSSKNSVLSDSKYVNHQMPKANNQSPLLKTADGKVLSPRTSENISRLSASSRRLSTSSKGCQPIRPVPELKESRVTRHLDSVENFPLAQGREVMVAAPMIGEGGGGRWGGRANRRQSLISYDGGPGLHPSVSYYGSMGGYYDDGYGYYDEGMEGYGRKPGYRGCSTRRKSAHLIYAAQMPETTLPDTLFGEGKNPPLTITDEPLDSPENNINTLKSENLENTRPDPLHQLSEGPNTKFMSSAQQTDNKREFEFICFSPEKFFKTTEGPHEPNSKLKWRIVIKRGDEE